MKSDKTASPLIAILRQVMAAKRYAALYEIVVGISKYNKGEESPIDMSEYEQSAWQLVIHHLEYLSKYGDSTPMVEVNGRKWFAHPEQFEIWLELGAPGVALDELQSYLDDFPI
ncbi:hypothetical protein ACQ4WY_26355 [Janthinobacterium sp. LB2P49]|uniref:hypothetical protein n=1 Tax=Janthinobacterium sp. LB2P49 TaxID=3424198 RepID=UPI003F2405F2